MQPEASEALGSVVVMLLFHMFREDGGSQVPLSILAKDQTLLQVVGRQGQRFAVAQRDGVIPAVQPQRLGHVVDRWGGHLRGVAVRQWQLEGAQPRRAEAVGLAQEQVTRRLLPSRAAATPTR